MLYWRRVLAVVRGCQAPKRISASPGGARKRARLGYTERSCTSGLYSGSGLRPMLRRVKHVEGEEAQSAGANLPHASDHYAGPPQATVKVIERMVRKIALSRKTAKYRSNALRERRPKTTLTKQ